MSSKVSEMDAVTSARLDALHAVLGAAAHEIRTPVASLKGTAQLALRRLERGDIASERERLTRALRLIDSEADRIARLLTQLIEAASVARGTARLVRAPVDLQDLVTGVVETLRAGGPPITLQRPAIPITVDVDAPRLSLALGALLESAGKYAPGEQVTVQITPALPAASTAASDDVRQAAPHATIIVRTKGPGIPSEDLQLLLGDPWDAVAGVGRAAGMGLFLCHQLLLLHGGRLEAETEAEHGTAFVVSLPESPPHALQTHQSDQ